MRQVVVCVWTVCVLVALASKASAAEDIVVHVGGGSPRGNWTRVADATAAGGYAMASSDRGWSATSTALAAPSDTIDLTVPADAGVTYRVWLRLRADGNSKWNDSVWLQFSDAVGSSGVPLYRIGSTAALLFNLEPCSGCGTSGWGWSGGAYWLAQETAVRFASGGMHTLRIQTREDGARVDQVVLSPATYASRAPGAAADDATILPAAPGDQPAGGPTPYLGYPVSLPGTVQARDYDRGGEGVAYHDSTRGNTGGAHRADDVDLESTAGGGDNIGWIDAGEWLNYSVTVAAAGTYTIQLRVASPSGGGSMHVGFNRSGVWSEVPVPATGGWQNWTTVSLTANLAAGPQLLTLLFDTAGFNVSRIMAAAAGSGSGGASSPYSGAPLAIPGTIEAEHFDHGGDGVGYHDATAGNAGGVFRSTDVDIEGTSGGYNVGWVSAGEWLQYSVAVASTGTYTLQARVAALGRGGTIHLEVDGADVSGAINIPDTGGWQAWRDVTATVQLSGGAHRLRVVADVSGANAVGNIDRLVFTSGGSTPAPATGNTITVGPGQSVQAAIDAARAGDTILLTPGAVYEGGLILRTKSGSDYITIRSAAPDSALPGPNTRITPAWASQLPKIQGGTAGLPAIMTERGAHHWRLLALELVDTWPYGDILALGDGSAAQTSLADVAHDLIVDRVYIHGVSGQQQKRGIALNSASTTIVNSYISDIRLANGDSQAIAGWNGPGPYTIVNNFLEATGENLLLGGSDPAISQLVPSDIVFRGNTVTKRPEWRWQGYTVKNLIEFKNAQRVTIDGNVLEYNWSGGQSGHAIVLTPRNQDGAAPWSVVQHITITNNVIRHVSGVLNILGTDYHYSSRPLTDVTFRNNLVVDLSAANWGGAGQLLLTSGGNNIRLDHNTVFTDGTSVVYADGNAVSGFRFTNNIIPDNAWAVMGAGASEGRGTLSAFFPDAVFVGNVIIGAQPTLYPAGNYFPPTVSGVGFVDPARDFRLAPSSPYIGAATDGTAIGAAIDAVNAAAGTSY